jgi:hypothetical protein
VLEGGEQQLLEACELLLLQRCFRELLLEEFVTTLHLVRVWSVYCFCQNTNTNSMVAHAACVAGLG